MRVLLFSHTFLPKIGGRELVVHYLAQALHEMGNDVRVFGPSGWWSNRTFGLDYPVHRVPSLVRRVSVPSSVVQGWRDRELGWHLRRLCRKHDIQIIHAHTTYPTGFIATHYGPNHPSLPVVVTPHGVDIHIIPELDFGMRLDSTLEPRIADTLKRANAITAISGGIRDSIRETGVLCEKIRNIPNGVDLMRFSGTATADVRAGLGLPSDSRLMVTVGNYHPRKGHEVLVQSMLAILAEQPELRLVIVGKGTEALLPKIQALGLEGKVTLTGAVPLPGNIIGANDSGREQIGDFLADLLRSATLYVSAGTTEGSEGLSLAVLEAMASGLPIVATAIAGNVDVVSHGKNGVLVAPSSADALASGVLELLKSANAAREMGQRGRELVEKKFSWKHVAHEYERVYESVIRGSTG